MRHYLVVTHSRKFTCLFTLGVGCIAATYALGIHFFLPGSPYSASLTAVIGSMCASFFLWRRFYEIKKRSRVSGVLLGGISGVVILFLGPLGFCVEVAMRHVGDMSFPSEVGFNLLMSLMSMPVVFLAMHGWSVVLAGVFWGGTMGIMEHKSFLKKEGKKTILPS